MQIVAILKAINEVQDRADLTRINKAVISQMRDLNRKATFVWSVGDQVDFDGRNGKRLTGQITKINQKTVLVKTLADGNWKVAASLLRNVK